MSLIQALESLVKESDVEEGITQELLDCVDLEVEFTPVIAIKGEGFEDAVEAIKTMGGRYIVRHPLIEGTVFEDGLIKMRLRYLLKLKEMQRRQYGGWFENLKHATTDV